MALIFGRFDKADEQVRDALLKLAMAESEEAAFDHPSEPYVQPATALFNYAVQREPDVKMRDLESCVAELAREAKRFGHLGPHCREYLARVRFRVIYGRHKPNGAPFDEDQDRTLSEWAALMNAKQRQSGARYRQA